MTSTQTGRTDNVVVQLDGDQFTYPAHDSGERWNGFAVPAFSRATAALLVERENDVDHGPEDDTLSWDGDVLVVTMPQADGEQVRIAPDEDGYYSTRELGWSWDVVGQLATLTLDGRTVTVTLTRTEDGDPHLTLDPDAWTTLDGEAPGSYFLVERAACRFCGGPLISVEDGVDACDRHATEF